jgi:hypothetical protein
MAIAAASADGKDVFGKNGLFDELKKALAEQMLGGIAISLRTIARSAWPSSSTRDDSPGRRTAMRKTLGRSK